MTGRRVAVLGGGMAALAAAWRLSDPGLAGEIASVTIYQRGHRLGGKAASHRGRHGRIEEHGLHVWLGYYDNAFRLIRQCYDQLDRPVTDPDCPIRTWSDAFAPAPVIGIEDFHDGDWSTWTAVFPPDDRLPGEPLGAEEPAVALDLVRHSVRLLSAFADSVGGVRPGMAASAALAATAEVERLATRLEGALPVLGALRLAAGGVRSALVGPVMADDGVRRTWQLLDLVTAQLRGMIADDLATRGFSSIDHIEYRRWIASHGASPETLRGALVRGLYDLAFSHRGGDTGRAEFPAGLGLMLATKTFFDYRGALFWKMQAGMGDVVIAPLYQALVERGVRFELFHRLDEVVASDDGTAVERVELGVQARLRDGAACYEPLRRYGGLPCFPPHPDRGQLADAAGIERAELESFWSDWPDVDRVTLLQGRDFDELVFAVPVGMARHVTGSLAAASAPWRTMLDTVETIGTQAFQLWLAPTEAELGWDRSGSTITSYGSSYDTWSSMTHLLTAEEWPADERPATVAYFCSSMAFDEPDDRTDPDQPRRARDRARRAAVEHLERAIGHYWPGALDGDGRFRWDMLVGAGGATGERALDSQHLTANVDPSDRYVQALPGTGHARLRPDRSGFAHLYLAGDWTDSGLNAGCIEAAVISGLAAANAVLGRPLHEGVTGGYGTNLANP